MSAAGGLLRPREGNLKASQKDDEPVKEEAKVCPYGCCKTESIGEYVFKQGFLEGKYSDVTLRAFGQKYRLHRLFLSRSGFFSGLLGWQTGRSKPHRRSSPDNTTDTKGGEDSEKDSDEDSDEEEEDKTFHYNLTFDSHYTQMSFELCLARLYGAVNLEEESKVPYNMITMGQYLVIPEVVCTATDVIVRNMKMSNLSSNLLFAMANNYGSASERILQNGKGILCSEGWEAGVAAWDGIPESVEAEVVGEDYFFVPTESDRCIFVMKLIERRLERGESVDELRHVLNNKIHYCHFPPEQLQELEKMYDASGRHYIEPAVLHNALWKAVELQRMVTSAQDDPQLNLVVSSSQPPESSAGHSEKGEEAKKQNAEPDWYKVPGNDDTMSGLPAELDDMLYRTNTDDSKTAGGDQEDSPRMFNWTRIPPFRFSVAFANVSDLITDKRMYAKTFWYAGSYWNLYLQKNHIVSKNTYQVGVYLHRANNGSLAPKNGLINADVYGNNVNYKDMPINYGSSRGSVDSASQLGEGSVRFLHRTVAQVNPEGSFTDSAASLSEVKDHVSDESLSGFSTLSLGDHQKWRTGTVNRSFCNYEDHRSSIRVYFVIFTPSRRVRPTLTSFISVPIDFTRSQSWGWKSNSMCVFNEDGTFPKGHDKNLKFMIVMGEV